MMMTVRGALPSTLNDVNKSESTDICAWPLTRSVLPDPGIKNSGATRGSRTMLRSESTRLLPRRSGYQRLFIVNANKTGHIAARRTIQSFRPAGCQRGKRRLVDQRAIWRRDLGRYLDSEGLVGLAVNRFKLFDRGNDRHCRSPDSRDRERALLAPSIAFDDLHKLARVVFDAADIGNRYVRPGCDISNGAAEPAFDLPVAAPRPRSTALSENIRWRRDRHHRD